jgi:hypothetical protein
MVWQATRRQQPNTPTFGVLLSADGVSGRRSGIGRMTLEIARRLRDPSVRNATLSGAAGLADIALLVGDSVAATDLLDRLTDAQDTPPGGAPAGAAGARPRNGEPLPERRRLARLATTPSARPYGPRHGTANRRQGRLSRIQPDRPPVRRCNRRDRARPVVACRSRTAST